MQVSSPIPPVAFGGIKHRVGAAIGATALLAAGLAGAGCSNGKTAASEAEKDGFARCESSHVSVEQTRGLIYPTTTVKACGDQTLLRYSSSGKVSVADTPDLTNIHAEPGGITAEYRGKQIKIEKKGGTLPNNYTITDTETGEVSASSANGADARQGE